MGDLAANKKPIRLKPKMVLTFSEPMTLELGPHQIAADLLLADPGGKKPWIEWDQANPHIGRVVTR